jgi:hypothetical protein
VASIGVDVFNPDASGPASCWKNYIRICSASIYVLVILCCSVLIIKLYKMQDLAGMRTDLLLSLHFTIALKFLNLIAFIEKAVFPNLEYYSYPASAIFPAVSSLAIAMYFVYRSSEMTKRIRNGGSGIKNLEEFHKHWNTTDGKARIVYLSKKLFVHEIILFLMSTDDEASQNVIIKSSDGIQKIWEIFVAPQSPWQLNISGDLKLRIKKYVERKEQSPEEAAKLIVLIRGEMLKILYFMMGEVLLLDSELEHEEAESALQPCFVFPQENLNWERFGQDKTASIEPIGRGGVEETSSLRN